jgi:hypothetical protein
MYFLFIFVESYNGSNNLKIVSSYPSEFVFVKILNDLSLSLLQQAKHNTKVFFLQICKGTIKYPLLIFSFDNAIWLRIDGIC